MNILFPLLIFITWSNASFASSGDQVLTLILEVHRQGEDWSWTLQKSILGPGKLKEPLPQPREDNRPDPGSSYLSFDWLDGRGNLLAATTYHTNPLQTRYEYPLDNGKLQTLSRQEDQQLIRLRINYRPELARLRIRQYRNGQLFLSTTLPIR